MWSVVSTAMNATQLSQNADFLSIALEEISAANYETAKEFTEDVRSNLEGYDKDEWAEPLDRAVEAMGRDEYDDAREEIRSTYGTLLKELDKVNGDI